MATKATVKAATPKTEKIIKVKPADHTVIKVKAAERGKSMGDYVAQLARNDK